MFSKLNETLATNIFFYDKKKITKLFLIKIASTKL